MVISSKCPGTHRLPIGNVHLLWLKKVEELPAVEYLNRQHSAEEVTGRPTMAGDSRGRFSNDGYKAFR